MDEKTNKKMEELFNLTKKLASEQLEASTKLDRLIEERWGFNHSETDNDPCIDTLDYGTQSISFTTYCNIMDGYKEQGYGE